MLNICDFIMCFINNMFKCVGSLKNPSIDTNLFSQNIKDEAVALAEVLPGNNLVIITVHECVQFFTSN